MSALCAGWQVKRPWLSLLAILLMMPVAYLLQLHHDELDPSQNVPLLGPKVLQVQRVRQPPLRVLEDLSQHSLNVVVRVPQRTRATVYHGIVITVLEHSFRK